jgi:hypothetical protein
MYLCMGILRVLSDDRERSMLSVQSLRNSCPRLLKIKSALHSTGIRCEHGPAKRVSLKDYRLDGMRMIIYTCIQPQSTNDYSKHS